MTHSAIDFLEKINQPKDNSLENVKFSKLLTFKNANPIRVIILSILSCFSHQVNSQSPQQTRSQSVAYQIKAEWFLKLPQYNLDSSFIYFERAINCLNSSEVSNYQSLSQANFNLYKHLLRINITPKIETYFKKARYYFNKIPNKTEATKLLEYDILIIDAEQSSRNGEQSRANNLMLRAFSLIQENKSPNIQARYLFDKGNLYNMLSSNAIALSNVYLLQSQKLYEAGNDPKKNERLFKIFGNLSWSVNNYGSADSCHYYFDKQKELLPILKNPYFTIYYSSTRANVYLRSKQYDKAAPLLLACQNVAEKYKLTRTEVYIFNTYLQGVMDLDFKKYDAAIKNFNKGIASAKFINSTIFIHDGYRHLSDAYVAKKDFKNAFENKSIWAGLNEQRNDKTLIKSLKENELKLNIVKKDNEIAQKAKERNWYIGALIAGLFLLALVYRNFRLKQKSNQQLELLNDELETKNTLLDKRNAENELLLKEIHHRVKNNLEVVSSLLALQSAKMDDPNMQEAMLASQNRVQSMGILHQKLYQSEHLAFIEMKNYFQNLCENILDSYNESERIKVDIDMKELNLDIDTAVPLGLIVNELFTNSLKYAFPMGGKGIIKLSLESLADGNLNLKVADNGVGKMLNSLPKGTGFGTQLVNLLTQQIDGKLVQEIHNGTIISINFKSQMAA